MYYKHKIKNIELSLTFCVEYNILGYNTVQSTRRYIPEDCTLHNHRCENLKSYILCTDYCNTAISVYLAEVDWFICKHFFI
jgi:hypothetical protein